MNEDDLFTLVATDDDSTARREYTVTQRVLGRGGFSKVYEGYRIERTSVAIKKIKIEHAKRQKVNLDAEIKIMKGLSHPNIVNLLDAIHQKGSMYLVIEHCTDGDLKKYLRRKRMKEAYVWFYLHQLKEGLRYLQSNNIIHRDLKPQNLLLTQQRQVLKISDFGFAKQLNSQESMAETMCGTPYYMAPEIMNNEKYTAKADLWSVGIIMFEMIYGKYPFRDVKNPFELREVLLNLIVTIPDHPETTDQCKHLLKGLLQTNPKNRIKWGNFFDHPWFAMYEITDQKKIKLKRRQSVSTFAEPTAPLCHSQSAPGLRSGGGFVSHPIKIPSVSPSSRNNVLSMITSGSPQSNSWFFDNTPNNVMDQTPEYAISPLGRSSFMTTHGPGSVSRFNESSTLKSTTTKPFLSLVENYTSNDSLANGLKPRNSEPTIVIRHDEEDNESSDSDDDDNSHTTTSTNNRTQSFNVRRRLTDYVSTSLNLLRDSVHSFHSLP